MAAAASKTIEDTYKKLTQLEHILLRPDSYIGSTERLSQATWVWDRAAQAMAHREISFVPGLYKIFDEILVNAADHKQRDASLNMIKVEIDVENNRISVYNNGAGIPIEVHKKEKIYVPEMIFGHLLTSSNYNDTEKKVVGGRNGYGAKLANIFSTEFVIETADTRHGRKYKQVFKNNMMARSEPVVKEGNTKEDWTRISFSPDLSRFNMDCLENDLVCLLEKRVYDIAGIHPAVNVYLNGEKIKVRSFKDYVALYPADKAETPRLHDRGSDRWEVVVGQSDGQFNQVSFVNSIWTMKGGAHVNHVADSIAAKLLEHLAKKHKNIKLKPFQIKNHLSIYVNCLIENPAFDSQTKETLTTRPNKFGSQWNIPDDLVKKLVNSTIVENILSFARFKQDKELKKTDGGKKARVLGIPKLDDANQAGSKTSSNCTLILTEGDSAKALAVSGLSVVGRDRYGVYPLRGKFLNVRDAAHSQIMENAEINNLKKILGLQHGKVYDRESLRTLRYGHVVIMTDQDHDGSHIKGLLINFFHHFWPSLLLIKGFLQEFVTPIVKCSKNREVQTFFTMPEYKVWVDAQDSLKAWKIKYYKGLGTSTAAEAKEYFSNLDKHLIEFKWSGDEDSTLITMAFAKAKVSDRKDWLANFVPGTYFDHVSDELTYSNFINKELILFSMADNERSIPCIMDGLKPSQRKVLFGCFKRKLKAEVKVAQLAGYISEHAAYHHGEMSLMATIVGLAQNFVGSNNINLLVPGGQFGTRLQGGKDAASSRYIFTNLSAITRVLYPTADDALLDYQEEDGMTIEPRWYCPIIPMILVNGADGIGTGWATSVPSYNPKDIIANLKMMMEGAEPAPMTPWYRGFKGRIQEVVGGQTYDVYGEVRRVDDDPQSVCVTELPVGSWTSPFKEWLNTATIGNAGAKAPFVKDYRDQSTEVSVNFTITGGDDLVPALQNDQDIYKKLKLSSSIACTNMVLFDEHGNIKKYESTEEIMSEFFTRRMELYSQRKAHLLKELEADVLKLENKTRFILMVVDGKLKVSKRAKAELLGDLAKRGFVAFPSSKKKVDETPEEDETNDEDSSKLAASSFDYLLSLPLWSLTKERVEDLCKQRDQKNAEMASLSKETPESLWRRDLDALEEALDKEEEKAAQARMELSKAAHKAQKGGRKGKSYVELDDADMELDDECVIEPPATRAVKTKKTREAAPKPKAALKAVGAKSSKAVSKTADDSMDESSQSETYVSEPESEPEFEMTTTKKTVPAPKPRAARKAIGAKASKAASKFADDSMDDEGSQSESYVSEPESEPESEVTETKKTVPANKPKATREAVGAKATKVAPKTVDASLDDEGSELELHAPEAESDMNVSNVDAQEEGSEDESVDGLFLNLSLAERLQQKMMGSTTVVPKAKPSSAVAPKKPATKAPAKGRSAAMPKASKPPASKPASAATKKALPSKVDDGVIVLSDSDDSSSDFVEPKKPQPAARKFGGAKKAGTTKAAPVMNDGFDFDDEDMSIASSAQVKPKPAPKARTKAAERPAPGKRDRKAITASPALVVERKPETKATPDPKRKKTQSKLAVEETTKENLSEVNERPPPRRAAKIAQKSVVAYAEGSDADVSSDESVSSFDDGDDSDFE